MKLKYKLIIEKEPVIEELEFETMEALQAKVLELNPPVVPTDGTGEAQV